jgi:toxin ParE1/3/4
MIAVICKVFPPRMCSPRRNASFGEASPLRRSRAGGVPCRGRLLQSDGSGAGRAFRRRGRGRIARALSFPLSGSPSELNLRRVMVRNFPFSVVYRPEAEGILVFAVAHHSRRPGYWVAESLHPDCVFTPRKVSTTSGTDILSAGTALCSGMPGTAADPKCRS